MNSQSLPYFSSLFIISLLIVWRLSNKLKPKNLKNLPPGPQKLPIIGNMHQFFGCLLHHRLRDMAKTYGPVLLLKFGEIPVVIISSAEAAKQVMKTHDILFAQRPTNLAAELIFYNRSDIVFASYGENWRQLRRICIIELLSLKQVKLFRSVREEEVLNLVKSVSRFAGCPINLSKMLFSCSCSIISRAIFGKKTKDQEAFIPIAEEVLNAMAGLSVSEIFPSVKFLPLITGYRSRLKKLHQEIDVVLENIINEHRICRATANYDNDLVHALLNLQEKEALEFPLTNESIKAVVLDMFLGGIDTVATTIEWAMSELIKDPRVMQKTQIEVREVFNVLDETSVNELSYLKSVTKETLRLHPPGPLISPRENTEQCKINDYDIPIKTKVFVNCWALGRDPAYWIEPEKFYPERFLDSNVDFKGGNYEFLPFGSGRRMCPGVSFGISNVELALAWLLYYFDWDVCNGMKKENLDMMESLGTVARRKNDLYLIPIPCHKLPHS